MMRFLVLLCLLPSFQMIVFHQEGEVQSGSSTFKCHFSLEYAPSGTVGKNSINCKPPKTFKVSNYILISKDPSQPCEFKLNFKVTKGKGRVAKGKAYCKS